MLGMMGLVAFAALPAAPPMLLVDIETRPAAPELVEANAEGVLYEQFAREGGRALYWSRWDGAPERVALTDGGITARRLGDGFILFRSVENGVNVERLQLAPSPSLEVLTTVDDVQVFPLADETSSIWWGGTGGTFTTDGTAAGTRQLTPLINPKAVLGEAIYFTDLRSVLRWENGELTRTTLPLSQFVRAGDHLVFNTPLAINELGVQLVPSTSCWPTAAGKFAWMTCAGADGGDDLFVTDGTAEGTTNRFEFRGEQRISVVVAATDEQAMFMAILDGGLGVYTLPRSGAATPQRFSRCNPRALADGHVVCPAGVASLTEPEFVPFSEVVKLTRAGARSLIQTRGEVRFLLSDGTRAGSQLVPTELPAWPTESSNPRLLESDGVRAIYASELGAWLTDGTKEGTFRAGDEAAFFGHSVLAADGVFVVYGADGQKWDPPEGVIGVAGGLLVGRNGCEAFSVGEDRVRRPLPDLGCVEQIESGSAGALVRNSVGATWLLRAGHDAYLLPSDVFLQGGVQCGQASCWFLTRQAQLFRVNRLVLESGALSTLAFPLETADFLASDFLFVSGSPRGQALVLDLDGGVTPVSPPFVLSPDGALVHLSRIGDAVQFLGPSTFVSKPVNCGSGLQLSITGGRLNLLCQVIEPRTNDTLQQLWSGPLDGGLTLVASDRLHREPSRMPTIPTGGDVAGFSLLGPPGGGAFVLTDGQSRTETAGLIGTGFTQVRGGYVFVGSQSSAPDLELWVIPQPQSSCGCTAGEGVFVLGLVLLVRRRRSTARSGR